MILALAGGVGGAKLAAGLAAVLPPGELVVAVNTGDDFEHLGLCICPDIDTVMYTLAGVANPETGWGQRDESWAFMGALERLGGPGWFRLGDRDLATHVERTRRLRSGESLSQVSALLCERLGVRHAVIPMSDQPVPTIVHTDEGELAFQDYFVRRRCAPRVQRLEYRATAGARLSPALDRVSRSPELEGIVICPSNPYLSIGPILALPGMRAAIAGSRAALAVSPVIAGKAVKGPTAKIMGELGIEPTALAIARFYEGLIDALVIDAADAALSSAIEALGVEVLADDTLMETHEDRVRVARTCLSRLRRRA